MHVAANARLPACAHLFISARRCLDTLNTFIFFFLQLLFQSWALHLPPSELLFDCRNVMCTITLYDDLKDLMGRVT